MSRIFFYPLYVVVSSARSPAAKEEVIFILASRAFNWI